MDNQPLLPVRQHSNRSPINYFISFVVLFACVVIIHDSFQGTREISSSSNLYESGVETGLSSEEEPANPAEPSTKFGSGVWDVEISDLESTEQKPKPKETPKPRKQVKSSEEDDTVILTKPKEPEPSTSVMPKKKEAKAKESGVFISTGSQEEAEFARLRGKKADCVNCIQSDKGKMTKPKEPEPSTSVMPKKKEAKTKESGVFISTGSQEEVEFARLRGKKADCVNCIQSDKGKSAKADYAEQAVGPANMKTVRKRLERAYGLDVEIGLSRGSEDLANPSEPSTKYGSGVWDSEEDDESGSEKEDEDESENTAADSDAAQSDDIDCSKKEETESTKLREKEEEDCDNCDQTEKEKPVQNNDVEQAVGPAKTRLESIQEIDDPDFGCGPGNPGPSGCDKVCGSTAVEDVCGICNGDGIPSEACDCDGNIDQGCGCGKTCFDEDNGADDEVGLGGDDSVTQLAEPSTKFGSGVFAPDEEPESDSTGMQKKDDLEDSKAAGEQQSTEGKDSVGTQKKDELKDSKAAVEQISTESKDASQTGGKVFLSTNSQEAAEMTKLKENAEANCSTCRSDTQEGKEVGSANVKPQGVRLAQKHASGTIVSADKLANPAEPSTKFGSGVWTPEDEPSNDSAGAQKSEEPTEKPVDKTSISNDDVEEEEEKQVGPPSSEKAKGKQTARSNSPKEPPTLRGDGGSSDSSNSPPKNEDQREIPPVQKQGSYPQAINPLEGAGPSSGSLEPSPVLRPVPGGSSTLAKSGSDSQMSRPGSMSGLDRFMGADSPASPDDSVHSGSRLLRPGMRLPSSQNSLEALQTLPRIESAGMRRPPGARDSDDDGMELQEIGAPSSVDEIPAPSQPRASCDDNEVGYENLVGKCSDINYHSIYLTWSTKIKVPMVVDRTEKCEGPRCTKKDKWVCCKQRRRCMNYGQDVPWGCGSQKVVNPYEYAFCQTFPCTEDDESMCCIPPVGALHERLATTRSEKARRAPNDDAPFADPPIAFNHHQVAWLDMSRAVTVDGEDWAPIVNFMENWGPPGGWQTPVFIKFTRDGDNEFRELKLNINRLNCEQTLDDMTGFRSETDTYLVSCPQFCFGKAEERGDQRFYRWKVNKGAHTKKGIPLYEDRDQSEPSLYGKFTDEKTFVSQAVTTSKNGRVWVQVRLHKKHIPKKQTGVPGNFYWMPTVKETKTDVITYVDQLVPEVKGCGGIGWMEDEWFSSDSPICVAARTLNLFGGEDELFEVTIGPKKKKYKGCLHGGIQTASLEDTSAVSKSLRIGYKGNEMMRKAIGYYDRTMSKFWREHSERIKNEGPTKVLMKWTARAGLYYQIMVLSSFAIDMTKHYDENWLFLILFAVLRPAYSMTVMVGLASSIEFLHPRGRDFMMKMLDLGPTNSDRRKKLTSLSTLFCKAFKGAFTCKNYFILLAIETFSLTMILLDITTKAFHLLIARILYLDVYNRVKRIPRRHPEVPSTEVALAGGENEPVIDYTHAFINALSERIKELVQKIIPEEGQESKYSRLDIFGWMAGFDVSKITGETEEELQASLDRECQPPKCVLGDFYEREDGGLGITSTGIPSLATNLGIDWELREAELRDGKRIVYFALRREDTAISAKILRDMCPNEKGKDDCPSLEVKMQTNQPKKQAKT